MNRIVVSDIFGRTPALEQLCTELPGATLIVDPYQGHFMNFSSEDDAYAYFVAEVGLTEYTETLHRKISEQNGNVELIGFSVGASAIWQLSERLSPDRISGAVCFYGSQIRHSVHLSPRFPTRLILPASEKHFPVQKLAEKLARKNHVEIHNSEFLHGFMNRYSMNYNQSAYQKYVQWLTNVRHTDHS